MSALRRHLRVLVLVWLACQTSAVAAFGPAGCCPPHARAVDAEAQCHGDAGGLCPMHAAGAGASDDAAVECPMHAGATTPSPCVMRGLCSGPSASVSLLFAVFGLPVPAQASTEIRHAAAEMPRPFRVLDVPARQDVPPPRI